ncbi:LANO_0B06810g1_1 [Lachancea nothofagi CBS 11611]|uniref:Actin-related protein 2/3 complex subunit 5 n=1 Tax=Lachancea nothofagi CBS 11611 TaxID=1266666 RepID=A0A1G4IZF0_9SACH|nr:LANO_0B06810g1_1 [Lachancea nothofagi CBS 11611]
MEDWRRIDIDAFDPDSGRLNVEDLKPPYEATISLAELEPKISQLRSAATSGDFATALQLLTSDPPYSADETAKARYFEAVLSVLTQVRQAEIASLIKQLSSTQIDVLIKYLYKGMSVPDGQKQGGILLSWFEKLTQNSGVAPVVRYLSDRNTV